MEWTTTLEAIDLRDVAISFDEPLEHRGWSEYRMRLRGDGETFIRMFNDPTCGWNTLRHELFPNAHVKHGRFEVSPFKRDTEITWVLVLRYFRIGEFVVPVEEIEADCRRLLLAMERCQKREEE